PNHAVPSRKGNNMADENFTYAHEVTLSAAQSKSAHLALEEVSMLCRSIHDLICAHFTSAETDAEGMAIMSMAKLGEFKAEQVTRTWGYDSFGNFLEEFGPALPEPFEAANAEERPQ